MTEPAEPQSVIEWLEADLKNKANNCSERKALVSFLLDALGPPGQYDESEHAHACIAELDAFLEEIESLQADTEDEFDLIDEEAP